MPTSIFLGVQKTGQREGNLAAADDHQMGVRKVAQDLGHGLNEEARSAQ